MTKHIDELANKATMEQIDSGSVTWVIAGPELFKAGYAAAVKDAQGLVDKAESVLWIDKCRCSEAWTGRNRHEPNTYCGELDPLREVLAKWKEMQE